MSVLTIMDEMLNNNNADVLSFRQIEEITQYETQFAKSRGLSSFKGPKVLVVCRQDLGTFPPSKLDAFVKSCPDIQSWRGSSARTNEGVAEVRSSRHDTLL